MSLLILSNAYVNSAFAFCKQINYKKYYFLKRYITVIFYDLLVFLNTFNCELSGSIITSPVSFSIMQLTAAMVYFMESPELISAKHDALIAQASS